ncbi:zinc finger, PHD-type [Artemisia annua]|uniref:Zinc finger, PHD-type n=1 Tax=Artemisia annua TaxID=35608 RepID=A0A2U1MF60_ARTAN|nr:zinc finger, PHD-type [Artemisia annua]
MNPMYVLIVNGCNILLDVSIPTPEFQVLPQQLSILVKQFVRISKELPKGEWFCCGDCDKTHTSFGATKKKQVQQGLEPSAELDIRWRLLSCKIASNDTRVLLSKAIAIFHDATACASG